MPLSQVVINKEKSYLGTITWKPFIWGPLSGGNFPGDIYLGVIISSQLFCEAIVWTPIVQALIIIIIIIFFFFLEGRLSGKQFLGRQLSRGQLSWAAIVLFSHVTFWYKCHLFLGLLSVYTTSIISFRLLSVRSTLCLCCPPHLNSK